MSDTSNALPGYSDSPDTPYNGTVRRGTAPSTFVRRLPGGSVYQEPAQKGEDGKSTEEYNAAHGIAVGSRTKGGPRKAKKS